MTSQSDDQLKCRDEILQVLYWMRGEGLGDRVGIASLRQLIHFDDNTVQSELQSLQEAGLITLEKNKGQPLIALSRQGLKEGRRRFSDEFDSFLGQESHTECSDPNCDCSNPEWDGTCTSSDHHHSS